MLQLTCNQAFTQQIGGQYEGADNAKVMSSSLILATNLLSKGLVKSQL